MAEIRNLTRNGETFYPLTHEKAVIGMEDFKDTITEQIDNYRPIEITGDVVNAPDEEDITSDSNNLLKFKNRNNLYGLGKIILRRGSSFASQVTQANTIYVIQYNFDLGGARINIPNGSILLFEGGSLSNGTLVCADLYDVRLVYYQDVTEILSGVTLEGNFIHKACDKDTIRQILVDNSSITKDANDVLSVKAGGIQNIHLNSNVVDDSSIALNSSNKISIKDGGVTGAKLNSGIVDTDDLSIVSNKIQLADRDTTNGMGMIILRKDQSFASQLTQTNTIYIIRYDFALAADVTLPANSVLKFEGGSLSGAYTINNINNCKFIGTNWLDNEITVLNQTFFKFSWLKGSNWSSYINKYNSETTFEIDKDIEISSGISLTGLSNITIISDYKTIKRVTNFFNMITISNSSNITLKGFIIDGNRGDKNLDSGSEYRFAGIYLDNCNNTVIDNLEINNTLNNENNQSVILVNNSNFTSILNSSFKGTEGSIIFFINECTHAIVNGCVARLKLGSFITGSVVFGLFTNNDIVGNNSDSLSHSAISMNSDKNTAENNIIENISGAGINIAHSGMIYDISVLGNIIKNCRLGGIYIASATNVNISNNTIDNSYPDNTESNRFAGIRSQVCNEIRIFNNNIKAKYHAIYFDKTDSTSINTEGKLVFIENNRLSTTNEISLLYKMVNNPIMVKNNIFDSSGGYCSNTWGYAKYVGNVFRGNTSAIVQTTRRAMIENNVFETTGSSISLNLNATYVSRYNEGNLVNITDSPAIDSNWIWATNS